MSFQLPHSFDMRVNNIVRCLDSYDAAKTDKEMDVLQREALAIACNLLATVDETILKNDLGIILGSPDSDTRQSAGQILQQEKLFETFLLMEDEMLRRTALLPQSRERILSLLRNVRSDTIMNIQTITADQIVDAFRELKSAVCELKDQFLRDAHQLDRIRLRNEKQTRIVNVLGSATIMVNALTGLAAATSVLFLPVASVAACAASVALGGVAQSQRPK